MYTPSATEFAASVLHPARHRHDRLLAPCLQVRHVLTTTHIAVHTTTTHIAVHTTTTHLTTIHTTTTHLTTTHVTTTHTTSDTTIRPTLDTHAELTRVSTTHMLS